MNVSVAQLMASSLFPDGFFSEEPEDLEKYGKDWSGVLTPSPSVIAFPRSTPDVSTLLKECSRLGIPVVPSGGRTGLSGGAVAARGELVLSLEKMNRIGEVDLRSLTIEVQAGAVTEAVHDAVKGDGLTWPVDFASKGSSNVGGNLSTNAGGVRVIRYGLTRNWVLGLTVVKMDGEILELNGALEKNNTGIDLCQVFIGSEGTLGVITEATLKLTRLPDDAKSQVLFFALRDFSTVLQIFRDARETTFMLSAFECLSAKCFQAVVGAGLKSPFQGSSGNPSASAEVFVLVEIEEVSAGETEKWLERILQLDGVLDAVGAQSPSQRASLWALREQVAEVILSRGETHQQDLSVPLASLGAFFSYVEARYAEAYPDFEVFIFGHIGDGNLHIFIQKPKDLSANEFHQRCAESDTMLFQLCQKFRGSVSAEHGIGLLKKPALLYSRSPEDLALCRSLKTVFDPKNLLNPGKML